MSSVELDHEAMICFESECEKGSIDEAEVQGFYTTLRR